MSDNTWGVAFKVTVFGESHGPALGMVIDGCPAGLTLDMAFLESEMARRKPGQSSITTARQEADEFEFISGVFEGKTTGTPIAAIIRNTNQRSKDYDHLKESFRPSHADFTYQEKYGHRDYRGGGRSSARETAARVLAGAIAKTILKELGILVQAYVSQVGHIKSDPEKIKLETTEQNAVRCPDQEAAREMIKLIQEIKSDGDTIGGIISALITGVPVGLGSPVFDKLHADLGKAMLSINAAKGFEYGSGFEGILLRGSSHNDIFTNEGGKIRTVTNHSGGIQGGISNGMPINFRVAFKPVATIMKNQTTVNAEGETTEVLGKGRHDPCVLPRAVPIVEAMAAITIVDHWLRNKTVKLKP